MPFYVNEDRSSRRAIVHRVVCILARHRTKYPRHGPFKAAADALNSAEGTGLVYTRLCRIRNPSSDLSIKYPVRRTHERGLAGRVLVGIILVSAMAQNIYWATQGPSWSFLVHRGDKYSVVSGHLFPHSRGDRNLAASTDKGVGGDSNG